MMPAGQARRIRERSIHRSAWRNCLENGRRSLKRAYLGARNGRSGPLRPFLATFGTPISVHIPIFQTVSEGLFSEVRIDPVLFGRAYYVEIEVLRGPMYIRLVIPTGRIMAPHRLGPPDRGYGADRTS